MKQPRTGRMWRIGAIQTSLVIDGRWRRWCVVRVTRPLWNPSRRRWLSRGTILYTATTKEVALRKARAIRRAPRGPA